jgi:hypothetical protein
MKFAKLSFWTAAVYGILVLTPLYFLFDRVGRDSPPPITHPELYYGFVGLALLAQFMFIIIAGDPVRFRPIMPIAIVEKFIYTVPVILLYLQHRVPQNVLLPSLVDPVFGVLFIISYFKTSPAVKASSAFAGSH